MSAYDGLYTFSEAMEVLCVNRTTLFDLLRNGELLSVKIGKNRMPLKESVDDYRRKHSTESQMLAELQTIRADLQAQLQQVDRQIAKLEKAGL